MVIYLEYSVSNGNYITDKITIYFFNDEVWIYKLGEYYNNLYIKIKNMNKQDIVEYFKPKHNYNFTQAC